MAAKKDPTDKIIETTLKLSGERGWRRLTMGEIAQEAGVSLPTLLTHFADKYAIINRFQDSVDHQMLAALEEAGDSAEGVRDRLFDLMMERFDILQPYRDGVNEIAKDSLGDPRAICFAARMKRSMSRMLEAAGVSSSGCVGTLRIKGLGLIYADAFRVWMKDDSPDMSKTMAALDRALKRAERFVSRLDRFGKRGSETTSEPEPA